MDFGDDADLARAIALSMQEEEAAQAKRKAQPSQTKTKTTTAPKKTAGKTGNGREKETAKTKPAPARKPKPAQEVLVISSDEDEDIMEVAAPVKAKGKGKEREREREVKKEEAKPASPPPRPAEAAPKAGAGPLSFLGDRAQLERERIARQKRMRGPSPPPAPPGAGSSDDEDDDEDDDGAGGSGSGSEGSARKRARLNSSGAAAVTKTGGAHGDDGRRLFPDGAILRVDTQHADPSIAAKPTCIRLSELLGPRAELSFAILSAFAVDPAWLYGFFERETPVVLVGDANTCGGDANSDVPTLKNVFPHWVRVCPPLPNGRGCMHMKLMLLFNKNGGLRVVVSTANLVPHDWRDVENYLFVQDLPPASPTLGVGQTTHTRPLEKPGESFPAMLARALRAIGVEEALEIMGRQGHTSLPLPTLIPSALHQPKSRHGPTPTPLETRWDWRRVRAALVPSIAGRAEGWAGEGAVVWSGQPRLLRAVQALGCGLEDGVVPGKNGSKKGKGKATAKAKGGKWEIELDCLTSSIGTYTPPWLAVFRLCAAGRAKGLQEWLDRGRKKTPPQGPTRVLFPTLETVRGTVLGEGGAGTVFCRRGQWSKISALIADERTGFEMRDAKSRSGLVGTHTKMILATLRGPPEVETDPEATESESETDDSSEIEVVESKNAHKEDGRPHAWLYVGSHNFTPSAWGTLSGSGFSPVLNVTNYELGVVLRLETPEDAAAAVAWERPARRYGRGDLPWIQEESPFFQ
ncbi:hypothetical protein B0H13DRAFT_691553 [Mycena leptocephala]|nr:hypothetical protein B0H13DRAFT_691553 [Mycena leptocephala]